MLRTASLLCCASATVGAAPAHPKLPQEWSAVETLAEVLNQGGEQDDDAGQVCCQLNAPQCKIQTQRAVQHHYFDHAGNRTRSGKAGTKGAIVSLYHYAKEVQVDETNTCTSYCPLPTHHLDRFHIDENATYGGSSTFDGKKVDMWTWTEYAVPKLKLLPIQVTNFYCTSGADPLPVKSTAVLEPLGKKVGTNNESWSEFTVGTPDASLFDVKGLSSCKQSQNCGQQQDRVSHRQYFRDTTTLEFHSTETVSTDSSEHSADPVRPTFPQQWTALQNSDLLIAQGAQQTDDEACCTYSSPGCKVQSEHQAVQFYFDGPNNRTRTGQAGADKAIVTDYNLKREMQVDANNTCITYCPTGNKLAAFGVDESAKYLGQATVDGATADVWKWTEYAIPKLHLGVLSVNTFYVSTDSHPQPLKQEQVLEPLGKYLGTENTTWIAFKSGAPAASLFDVPNAATCPEDKNCNQQ